MLPIQLTYSLRRVSFLDQFRRVSGASPHTIIPAINQSIAGFQCNVQHVFQYTGAFPKKRVQEQWQEQVSDKKRKYGYRILIFQ